MTTKPKAKRFRVRRNSGANGGNGVDPPSEMHFNAQPDQPDQPVQADDGPLLPDSEPDIFASDPGTFGSKTFTSRRGSQAGSQAGSQGETAQTNAQNAQIVEADDGRRPEKPAPRPVPTDAKPPNTIDEIRREGLTGRQLRMARRVAQKQGLEPESDYDAVRLLRDEGIDPFKRSNMLELVVTGENSETAKGAEAPSMLPVTIRQSPQVPSPEVIRQPPANETDGSKGIMDIQRDLARRRRRRSFLMAVRLLFFVLLPTIVAGYYYYTVATPMYATKSEFVIQKAESSGGQLGSLFSGTGLATSQDAITVQGYLQSRDAMLRLNEDEGFKSHFSQPRIDPLQRLEDDSTNEATYKLFKKHVKIGFDPTEGVIKMEVIAADPDTSAKFSKKLIEYAEQQVDHLTSRLRADQMEGAEQSREDAESKMIAAQERIVNLQERLGVLSPESEVQAVFGQITQLESELLAERLALDQYLSNLRPNTARVNAAENKISQLEGLIAEKRAQLTQSTKSTGSLARVSGELLVAQADLETRQGLLAQAEAQFESARLEANRQVRYLSIGVSPVAPDEPTYPRAFENTILAFLIFAGIYLMISLTASILREQV